MSAGHSRFCSDPKEFEKDMSLIMNGTQEMWMKDYANMYNKNHIGKTEGYLRYGKGNFKENEAEYQKQLDIAYTIGGINFKYYMQKDMEMPMEWRMGDEQYQWAYLRELKDLPFKDNMSFEQYNSLLQHLYVATQMKTEIDNSFNSEEAKNLTHRERDMIQCGMAGASWGRAALKENKAVKESVNMGLNKALGEYGERASVPSENKANYQAALKSLYNINGIDYYSLLNIDPQEKMPIEKTERVKEFEEKSLFKRCMDKMRWWRDQIRDKVANLSEKKEKATPKQKEPKDYLKNYPKWSKDKRVSEVQYEEILDFDKPVITGRPIRQGKFEAVRRSKSTDFKTADEALRASKEASTPENLDRAAYLKSLSGRTQQDTTARVSPSFSRMRDSKSSMELMLLRRQMGR